MQLRNVVEVSVRLSWRDIEYLFKCFVRKVCQLNRIAKVCFDVKLLYSPGQKYINRCLGLT